MDPPIPSTEPQDQSTKESTTNQQNDSGCETSSRSELAEDFKSITQTREDAEDLAILRKDPKTNRKLIDKEAYAKLQRSLTPPRNNSHLESLKKNYETPTEKKPKLKRASAIKLDEAAVHALRNKSRLPVPKARTSVKSEIFLSQRNPLETANYRHTLNLGSKDENSNEVYRKSSSTSEDFITIVTRSESECSVDKFEKELSLFTMDRKPKEKKRSNSFRKIFSGKIFGKDKKKKEEEQSKLQHKVNVVHSDNMQNETNAFSRDSPYRHTIGGDNSLSKSTRMSREDRDRQVRKTNYDMKEIEKQYAQMHVREFNHIKQNFENRHPDDDEPSPIITNNPGPIDYKNIPNINKFIDTSSSVSTLDSDISHTNAQFNNDNESSNRFVRFSENHKENSRDTPPRAQELRQDVRLVNPKALIPINSERPLPNPYQNNGSLSPRPKIEPKPTKTNQHFDFEDANRATSSPRFEETYGTVFDSLEAKNAAQRRASAKVAQRIPRSPSLESTKLRLPSNREISPLSPRMKSPIPQHHVSTEKIIATELLKPRSRSPTPTRKKPSQPSPSLPKLETVDYPDNVSNERNERSFEKAALASKPPISRIPERNHTYVQRISQQSPNYDIRVQDVSVGSQEKIFTNALVHQANSIITRTPTPTSLLHNRSLSPIGPHSHRSSTPDMRATSSTKSTSPQKDEIRRSVEAYYWKEIKKLKEQENMDLYYYQQQMIPFGYAEDPINVRRSRSSSPSSARTGRRSLSLPRDPKPRAGQVEMIDGVGRFQPTPIPEGRAVVNQPNGAYYHQNFKRNTPERRTIDSLHRSNDNYANGTYRPIFKRGSLTTPVRELSEDQQNKKVSFGTEENPANQSWPTRNGFTQSPPQRRLEMNRNNSLDDDVFLPNPPQTSKLVVDGKEVYGYANRPYDYVQNYDYVSRQQILQQQQHPAVRYRPNLVEPVYGSRQLLPPQEEIYYRQSVDTVRAPYNLTRHGSIQFPESTYGSERISRRISYDNPQAMRPGQNLGYPAPRRQIIIKDEIYGQFGGYLPQTPKEQPHQVYSSRQNVVDPHYGYNRGLHKQISVRDRVCDMYGQIHDRDSPSLAQPNSMKQSGVILGQLQRSPQVVRQPHLQNENFVRNSRLTASANDMYRRSQSVDRRYTSDVVYGQEVAPTRPLPPVPTDKKVVMRPNGGEIQRMNNCNSRNKKRGLFGNHTTESPLISHVTNLDEETKKLSTAKLERLVLLEKLQLFRLKQQVVRKKMSKRNEFYISRQDSPEVLNIIDHLGESAEKVVLPESEETRKLRLSDLRRIVLLEELQLIRLKSSAESVYAKVKIV